MLLPNPQNGFREYKKINNNYPKPQITKCQTINHIPLPLFPNASTRRASPLNFILQNINLTRRKGKKNAFSVYTRQAAPQVADKIQEQKLP